MSITKEEAEGFIASVEKMLEKEQTHLKYLEDNRKSVSDVLDISKMIETSKMWIKHFETRLKQYRETWLKE